MTEEDKMKYLLRRVLYNPETGEFTWLPKEVVSCFDKSFNTRLAGKPAGCANKCGHQIISFMFEGVCRVVVSHRFAYYFVYGILPSEVDHIDHNPWNNKIDNLRGVTHKENMCNMKLSSSNKSGIMCVCWSKSNNKWRAYCFTNGKQCHLGYFDSIERATSVVKQFREDIGHHANHGLKDAQK